MSMIMILLPLISNQLAAQKPLDYYVNEQAVLSKDARLLLSGGYMNALGVSRSDLETRRTLSDTLRYLSAGNEWERIVTSSQAFHLKGRADLMRPKVDMERRILYPFGKKGIAVLVVLRNPQRKDGFLIVNLDIRGDNPNPFIPITPMYGHNAAFIYKGSERIRMVSLLRVEPNGRRWIVSDLVGTKWIMRGEKRLPPNVIPKDFLLDFRSGSERYFSGRELKTNGVPKLFDLEQQRMFDVPSVLHGRKLELSWSGPRLLIHQIDADRERIATWQWPLPPTQRIRRLPRPVVASSPDGRWNLERQPNGTFRTTRMR